MRPLEYDLELIKLIVQLRERTGYKHINLAQVLGIDRTTYGRIEHGEACFTPGQLRVLAQALKTNHYQLMALVDAKLEDAFYKTTFSSILIKALKMIEGKDEDINFSETELQFVLSIIQKKYEEMWVKYPFLR